MAPGTALKSGRQMDWVPGRDGTRNNCFRPRSKSKRTRKKYPPLGQPSGTRHPQCTARRTQRQLVGAHLERLMGPATQLLQERTNKMCIAAPGRQSLSWARKLHRWKPRTAHFLPGALAPYAAHHCTADLNAGHGGACTRPHALTAASERRSPQTHAKATPYLNEPNRDYHKKATHQRQSIVPHASLPRRATEPYATRFLDPLVRPGATKGACAQEEAAASTSAPKHGSGQGSARKMRKARQL